MRCGQVEGRPGTAVRLMTAPGDQAAREGRKGRWEEELPPPLTNGQTDKQGPALEMAAEAGQGRPHFQTLCVREPPKGRVLRHLQMTKGRWKVCALITM